MRTREAKEMKLPIFAKRFGQLRADMTQAEFADFLGISRPTVGFYENGERIPDASVLIRIAKKCNVSTDWLLGISDNRITDNRTIGEVTGLNDEAIEFLSMCKMSESEKIDAFASFLIQNAKCSTVTPSELEEMKSIDIFNMEKFKLIDIVNDVLNSESFFAFLLFFCKSVRHAQNFYKSNESQCQNCLTNYNAVLKVKNLLPKGYTIVSSLEASENEFFNSIHAIRFVASELKEKYLDELVGNNSNRKSDDARGNENAEHNETDE